MVLEHFNVLQESSIPHKPIANKTLPREMLGKLMPSESPIPCMYVILSSDWLVDSIPMTLSLALAL